MIHVTGQPEPSTFREQVADPGTHFLQQTPRPTTKQWRGHEYWRRALPDLYKAYSSVCAYSCHWIAPDTGAKSVEHFEPKSHAPSMAYDWNNYRLVCERLNARKGIRRILDPFLLQDGTFAIDFPSLLVIPGPLCLADEVLHRMAIETRTILGLNDETTCVANRWKYISLYCDEQVMFGVLLEQAPFLAAELLRQGLKDVARLRAIMSYPFNV